MLTRNTIRRNSKFEKSPNLKLNLAFFSREREFAGIPRRRKSNKRKENGTGVEFHPQANIHANVLGVNMLVNLGLLKCNIPSQHFSRAYTRRNELSPFWVRQALRISKDAHRKRIWPPQLRFS